MPYKITSNTRRLRAKIKFLASFLSFKYFSSSYPDKIILFWLLISFVSFFLPWIFMKWFSGNSFSLELWYLWYVLCCLNFLVFLVTFSNNKKENIKRNTSLSFKDHFFVIFSWFVALLLLFVSFNFVRAITLRDTLEAVYWEWFIFAFIWYIFVIVWWFMLLRQYRKDIWEVFTDENIEGLQMKNSSSNMKLPF